MPIILERIYYYICDYLRYYYYYPSFKKIGKRVPIPRNVSFGGIYNIEIGDNVSINQGCSLYGDYGISIGENSKLSPYVQIYSANYRYANKKQLGSMGTIGKKIVIGKNVWIGAGSIILSGVNIGDNSIIAAGSVVYRNIPANEMWGGNPVHFIKRI